MKLELNTTGSWRVVLRGLDEAAVRRACEAVAVLGDLDASKRPAKWRMVSEGTDRVVSRCEGPDAVAREFTMSVPARPERDADLVLSAAADEIEVLEAELAVCREAIEVCLDVAENLPSDDDGATAVRRCTLRRLNEAIGKAVPRLMFERPEGQKLYGLNYMEMRERIEALEATLDRQQLSYERERNLDQEEIERLIALRRDDARALERMRALIADAEVIATYGRDDGLRDWVDAGAWLSPGDRIVVQSLPPQLPNEHGHVLTTEALWEMYVEDPETPDEPRAG